jgi:hypothetical protein
MIIGHATCAGSGPNRLVSLISLAQAAAGSVTVPPAGSQRNVYCAAAVVGDPLKLTVSEIFAVSGVAGPLLPAAGGLEPDPPAVGVPLPVAAALPQAATSNAHAPAAAQQDRIRAE